MIELKLLCLRISKWRRRKKGKQTPDNDAAGLANNADGDANAARLPTARSNSTLRSPSQRAAKSGSGQRGIELADRNHQQQQQAQPLHEQRPSSSPPHLSPSSPSSPSSQPKFSRRGPSATASNDAARSLNPTPTSHAVTNSDGRSSQQTTQDTHTDTDTPRTNIGPVSHTSPLSQSGQLTLVNQQHKRRKEKVQEERFQEELDKCRRSFEKIYVHPEIGNPKHWQTRTFVPLRKLRQCLTRDVLATLLRDLPWYKIEYNEKLFDQFLRIIATLIQSGFKDWADWCQFADLFYSLREGTNFTRCDLHLPLDHSALDFLKDTSVRDNFYRYQHLFDPQILQEEDSSHRDVTELGEHARLPFSKIESIRHVDGSPRCIRKATIDVHGLRSINREDMRLQPNESLKLVAIKEFRDRGEFDKERKIHHVLKSGRSRHDHIVVAITSYIQQFSHITINYILYPWADTDLFKLCFGFVPSASLNSELYTPYRVMDQVRGLFDAIRFIHTDRDILHLDFKLENFLVFALFDNPNNPIGIWKIADFGTAKERHTIKEQARRALPQSEFTPSARREGTYQAPEVRSEGAVSAKSDMFSMGCVLAVLLIFMLGGPDAVVEFQNIRRQTSHSDQFWEPDNLSFVIRQRIWDFIHIRIKDQIVDGGEGQIAQRFPGTKHWARQILRLIARLLIPEDSVTRIDAQRALDKVRKILLSIKDQTTAANIARATNNMGAHPPGNGDFAPGPGDLRVKWHHVPGEIPMPEAVDLSQDLRHGDVTDEFAWRRNIRTRLEEDASIWLSERSTYCRLDTNFHDTRPLMARLSDDWAVYMYEKEVRIFNLREIAASGSALPSTTDRLEAFVPIEPSLKISATERYRFRTFRLAGSFLALVREVDDTAMDGTAVVGTSRDVKVFKLNDEDESGAVRTWLREKPIPEDCQDVIISAQGTLARLFKDYVLITPASAQEPSGERQITGEKGDSMVRTAAFSANGQHLCVWFVQRSQSTWRNVWKAWDFDTLISDSSIQPFWKWSQEEAAPDTDSDNGRTNMDQSCRQTPFLASIGTGCHFFAFGQRQQLWCLTPRDNESHRMAAVSHTWTVHDIIVDVPLYPLPVPSYSCLVLRQANGKISASASFGAPSRGKKVQPFITTGSLLPHDWRQASEQPLVDAVVCHIGARDGCAFLYLDGLLELRPRRAM